MSTASRASKSAFSKLAKGILTAYWEANPTEAVFYGLHRYGGRVMDLRPVSMQRRLARIRRDLNSLVAVGDVDELSPDLRLELGILRSKLLVEQFMLAGSREPRESPLATVGALNLVNYLLKEYAPLDARLRSAEKLQAQVPTYLDVVRRITTRQLAETQYEMGEMVVSGIIDSYREELPPFFEKVPPATRRRLERTNAVATAALEGFHQELQAKYKPRIRKTFALGRRKYERMLWAEHLSRLSIERLLEVGTADLGANRSAFTEAARAVDPSKDPAAVMRDISSDHPTAETLIEDAARTLEDIRSFIVGHDNVTIPAED
ncbi:MAG TPA: DUF885 family protein, partial [Thermoplasmata archaeon]|nr:DUF885 family protein [Thermoplasmata archaeon]